MTSYITNSLISEREIGAIAASRWLEKVPTFYAYEFLYQVGTTSSRVDSWMKEDSPLPPWFPIQRMGIRKKGGRENLKYCLGFHEAVFSAYGHRFECLTHCRYEQGLKLGKKWASSASTALLAELRRNLGDKYSRTILDDHEPGDGYDFFSPGHHIVSLIYGEKSILDTDGNFNPQSPAFYDFWNNLVPGFAPKIDLATEPRIAHAVTDSSFARGFIDGASGAYDNCLADVETFRKMAP